MFKLGFVVFAASISVAAPAQAGISDDLKFCAGLTSGKERLACYDAAARIEKQKPKVKQASELKAPRPSPNALAAAYTPPPMSPFEGAYVGITGGYDVGLTESTGDTRGSSSSGYSPYIHPSVPNDSLRGAKIGLLTGYNVVSDRLLFGLEARAQYLFARNSASHLFTSSFSLPWVAGTCWGCSSGFPPQYSRLELNPSFLNRVIRERNWQIDFAARSGFVLNDWLIYAKAGIGAEETTSTSIYDSSGTTICHNPHVSEIPIGGGGIQYVADSCGSTSRGPIMTIVSRRIDPIFIVGAGIEKTFGSYFARAEAEFIAHLAPGSAFYTPSVNVTAGYRF